jgi:ABC-2 type transport system permease protein
MATSPRGALALYARYVGISIRAQLQYRASFAMRTVGQLLVTGIEFLGIWALFDRFGSIGGWSLAQVAFFYGLADVTFALADGLWRGFDQVAPLIKSGELDRILLRPRSTVLQLMGQELTLARMGRLIQGLVVLVWASQSSAVVWSAAKLALLLGAVGGGICLFGGIVVLQATSAFWTIEALELWSAFTYGGNYAAQYPLTIYRPWFRWFFIAVIPIGCVVYFPAVAILGVRDPLGSPTAFQWSAPLAGVAFLIVALQVWKLGSQSTRRPAAEAGHQIRARTDSGRTMASPGRQPNARANSGMLESGPRAPVDPLQDASSARSAPARCAMPRGGGSGVESHRWIRDGDRRRSERPRAGA